MWKTRKDFERDLVESYRSSEMDFGQESRSLGRQFLNVGPKNKRPPNEVAKTLSILDDLILDAVFWSHAFSIELYETKRWQRDEILSAPLRRF